MKILKNLRKEDGQVLVITALSGLLLMGSLALAVDVGTLFNAERKVQVAADAGAVAGALEKQYGSGSYSTKAYNAASSNLPTTYTPVLKTTYSSCHSAVTNTSTAPAVCVISPPTHGYHNGSAFLEVDVVQPNPTFFMGAILPGVGKIPVAARAVAGTVASTACVYILDPTAADALKIKGSSTIYSPGCGWDVASTSNQDVCITGNGNTLDVPYLRLGTSSLQTSGSCNKLPSAPYTTGNGAITDPLKLSGPSTCDATVTQSTMNLSNGTSDAAYATINTYVTGHTSGTICFTSTSGMSISGTGTIGSTTGSYTFEFQDGLHVTTGANVTVDGTVDIAGANTSYSLQGSSCNGSTPNGTGLVQDSQSGLNVVAPSTGTYHGLAIMQPAPLATPLELQFGSNSGTYTADTTGTACSVFTGSCGDHNYACGSECGIIYAPDATVYLHDNGGGVTATGLVSDKLLVCSSQLSIESYNNAPGNASPLNQVSLVE